MRFFFVEMRSLCFTFSSHAGTVCCVNSHSLEKYMHILWAAPWHHKAKPVLVSFTWQQWKLGTFGCTDSPSLCMQLFQVTGDIGQLWPWKSGVMRCLARTDLSDTHPTLGSKEPGLISSAQFQGEALALCLLSAPHDKSTVFVISVIPATLHGRVLHVFSKLYLLTSSFFPVLLILCTNTSTVSTAGQVKLRISREGGYHWYAPGPKHICQTLELWASWPGQGGGGMSPMPVHCPNLIQEKEAFNVKTHTGHHNQDPRTALIRTLSGMCKVQYIVTSVTQPPKSAMEEKEKTNTAICSFPQFELATIYGFPQRWAALLSLTFSVNSLSLPPLEPFDLVLLPSELGTG